MQASDPLTSADSANRPGDGLVLGIAPGTTATGLALRNPASRPQLTWGAILAPADGEELADYADRITALAVTIREHRPTEPVTVHLAGAPTGHIPRGHAQPPDAKLRALTRAIELALEPPMVVVPAGEAAPARGDTRPAPLRDRWPAGWYPRQHHDLTPVVAAALLTRWVPYSPPPSPAPLPTQLDRAGRLGGVAPLSGHEARSAPEGDAPPPGLPASPPGAPLASVTDGRR